MNATFLTTFLRILGWADIVLAPFLILVSLAQAPDLNGIVVGQALLGVLLALTLGGTLLGMSGLLSASTTGEESGARLQDASSRTTPSSEPADSNESALGAGASRDALVKQVCQIRDWLVTRQTGADPKALKDALERDIGRDIVDALNQRKFSSARQLLESAKLVLGPSALMLKLSERLDSTARRSEPLDYARTRRIVDERIQRGHWSLAEQASRDLYRDYPDVPRCRKIWEDTRKAKLYAYIDVNVERRHWQEAVASSEEFLARFPESPEARLIRTKLDDIKHNAAVEHRRQLESRLNERLAVADFVEALSIAEFFVNEYPNSQQAPSLRAKIPELAKRAAQQKSGAS